MVATLAPPPISGGYTFAEQPSIAAPDATLIWRASFDPTTLHVVAVPAGDACADALHPASLSSWMSVVTDDAGREHIVLSNGRLHIRLDVDRGSLAAGEPVVLHYRLHGLGSAQTKILPLQRFLHLCRHHRFSRSLFGPDPSIPRWITLLRVHDAEMAGASQRDIAQTLFGPVVDRDWRRSADSWRSRVRRLVYEARAMASGGYRLLLRGSGKLP